MSSNSTPFVENYLAFLLAKASHMISGGFHLRLKTLGISISTWRILAVINDGAITVGELAELVLINQSTLSKTLDKLEKDGLVNRERDQGNRRTVYISLTNQGQSLINDLIPLANNHEAECFDHLTVDEKKQLVTLLQKTINEVADKATGDAS